MVSDAAMFFWRHLETTPYVINFVVWSILGKMRRTWDSIELQFIDVCLVSIFLSKSVYMFRKTAPNYFNVDLISKFLGRM